MGDRREYTDPELTLKQWAEGCVTPLQPISEQDRQRMEQRLDAAEFNATTLYEASSVALSQ